MGRLTAQCPKPLLRVGSRPILEHILLGLAGAGVTRAVVVLGYLGQQIVDALGDGRDLGVELDYVWQEHATGTAEALLLAQPKVSRGPFFLSWGDVLVSPENYVSLRDAFARQPAAAWIGVNKVDDPTSGAAVYFDQSGQVRRIVEKPAPGTSTTRWNNAGVGIYDTQVFRYAAAVPVSPRGERELPQALDLMIAAGEAVYALPLRGFWSDIGTPEALAEAQRTYCSQH